MGWWGDFDVQDCLEIWLCLMTLLKWILHSNCRLSKKLIKHIQINKGLHLFIWIIRLIMHIEIYCSWEVFREPVYSQWGSYLVDCLVYCPSRWRQPLIALFWEHWILILKTFVLPSVLHESSDEREVCSHSQSKILLRE